MPVRIACGHMVIPATCDRPGIVAHKPGMEACEQVEPSTIPAGESSGAAMCCPQCGSTDVDCTSTNKAHVHHCNACQYTTTAAAVKR